MDGHETDGELEALLARCLDDFELRGVQAIEDACRERPDLAPRLRERLGSLARLGLLESGSDALPDSIGSWRPRARLGRGGMSVVYLAEGADGARAALKLMTAPSELAPNQRARFEREIRAFAELDHPLVVRVLDWGEHEGRPWYAMQYVPGATLADVVAELRARGLDPARTSAEAARALVRALLPEGVEAAPQDAGQPARAAGSWVELAARIALDVAEALAHLHARGVVHRDVKPGNVLLGLDGRARLIDLGLAQIADEPSLTRTGEFAGTPYYVSPEQARSERARIGPRTDVYSLGATLYELLTLRRPFEGPSSAHVLARIAREEPPPPRRIVRELPRDLETICLSALEKEPERRYAGAEELAADLRRFLAFQPVLARPAGPLVRARRFARRDPGRAVALLLGASIALGVPAGLLASNAAIRTQRDAADFAAHQALREARTSQLVVEFLVDLFREPGGAAARPRTARELLERGAHRARTSGAGDPLARAALLEATGRAYQNLGLFEKALQSFDRAFALRHRTLGEDHPDVARALHHVGALHLELGHVEVARALLQRGLAASTRAGTLETLAVARLRTTLADVLERTADARGAERELGLALATLEGLGAESGPDAARAHELRGALWLDARRCAEARAELAQAARLHGRTLDPDLVARARVLALLARAEECAGDPLAAARARADLAELDVRLRASRNAPLPAGVAWSEADQEAALAGFLPPGQAEFDRRFQEGITALQAGAHARAATAFARCAELRPRHPVASYNLACALAQAGRADEGFAALERAAELGFGDLPDRLEVARADGDIAALRRDSRWPELERRMQLRLEDQRARLAAAEVELPGPEPPASGWPLLVVLREADGTGRALGEGEWRRSALALGSALLELSPGAGPGETWVPDPRDFAERRWSYVEPVLDAIQRAVEREPVDALRIVLVGEGSGALPAFELAVRSRGLVRGVLALDGPLDTAIERDEVAAAAAAGLRLSFVRAADGAAGEELAALFERWFAHAGFGAGARQRLLAPRADDGALAEAVATELRALLAAGGG